MAFVTPVHLARAGTRSLATTPVTRLARPQTPLRSSPARTMFGAASARAAIAKGDRAPDFSLPDQSGKTVSLSDYAGKSAVALFFYPKG
jgi:cytochrome oxidase Cu insertion factor (SCO1/SenC/PrrC family)